MLIVLEGIDGCGKTTLAKSLHSHLSAIGKDSIVTSDFTGTKLGVLAREMIVEQNIHPNEALILVSAARYRHYEEVIKPSLNEGKIVICDRFANSTYAYQVAGDSACKDLFFSIGRGQIYQEAYDKTIALYLSVTLEVAKKRAEMRGELDRFERKGDEYFRRVIQAFDGCHLNYVDAKQSEEDVFRRALSIISKSEFF